MSFLLTNGIRTHYQQLAATNPPRLPAPQVVFIHGLGFDSLASFWLTLAPPVAAAGVDVLTYDLRAHGRSDRPDRGYLLQDFTADLTGLLDGIDVTEPVHLVGNSFGGTLAFAFAARHPTRVRSVVSIESEPPTEQWSAKMRDTITGIVDGMEAERYLTMIEQTYGPHAVRLSRSAAKIIRATSIIEDVPSGPFLNAAALAALTCPVLSIMGDEGFHREDIRGLERLLPYCRTEIISRQDHSVLVERHHEIGPLVLDWIMRDHQRLAVDSQDTR